ncbi:MAG: isoprenylcysteine carboxylmethyltransferase family protein [Nitrospiraceae bacterium]|nr:MAG: isoprenylcysteine carboxylmethyltransferase family protein [Nitrospiraceae bacterium]
MGTGEEVQLALRKGIVFLSALIYWGGVMLNARRIRKRIGRAPNLRPGSLKERVLWLCWFFVIAGWAGQPFLIGRDNPSSLFALISSMTTPAGFYAGIAMAALGYAGTLWCYAVLGTSWRIGVHAAERTALVRSGPYRSIRHPIYLFQMIILAGMMLLIPTAFSFILLLVLFFSALVKTLDEEAYLMGIHGKEYRAYYETTGRFLPRWKRNPARS